MNLRSIMTVCAITGIATGAMISLSPAHAQDDSYYADERVIVEAPYLQKDNLGRAPDSALPRQRVSYNIAVDVSDLDFSSRADWARLEDRIHDAAWEACRQLDRRYPGSIYVPETSESRSQCAERAADYGLAQARMIAEARDKQPRNR